MIVLTASRQWPSVARTIRESKVVGVLLVTALLIGGNWSVVIYAVLIDRIVASSLGYFLNPLVSVFLGFVFLRERLSALQWTAVALAAAGVGVQIVAYGSLPWLSLVLALRFAIYGLLRKTVAAGARVGLFVEALLLSTAVERR